jgi:hypothetical protein
MNNDLDRIKARFDELQVQYPDGYIMHDGVLNEQEYQFAKVKILWILKQDYSDSGAQELPYIVRLTDENIRASPTWRRMSYVSYGLLSGEREFNPYPNAAICAEQLRKTAIIEVNKELGESQSSNNAISNGFLRYKELVFLQIDTYKPDVVIVCLPEALKPILNSLYKHCHNTDFQPRLKNVIIDGADVAIGNECNPLFLWAYHPAVTKGAFDKGVTDDSYTKALLKAYDRAMCVEI